MMKKFGKYLILLIIISIICISFIIFSKNEKIDYDNKIDALSYKMDLKIDTKENILYEDVVINFKNNTKNSIDEIIVRDMSASIHEYNKEYYKEDNVNNKSVIDSITYNNENINFKYGKDKSIIIIKLPQAIKPNQEKSINIKMNTNIPLRQDRFGLVIKDLKRIYTLSFCFPYLADNYNGNWLLDPYFDDGESRSYDLANYDVTISMPKDYKVVATGSENMIDNTTYIEANDVRDFAIVASNFIQKDTFKVQDITVNNYYFDNVKNDVYRKLTKLVITDSINLYSEKIGKYPYPELDILPCIFGFSFGGMEYPRLVMTNATSFYDGVMPDAWSLSEGLAHEIAHQWFYATIGNREYTEGWIDEAFTTYLERSVFNLYDGEAYKYLTDIDKLVPKIDDSLKSRVELIEIARDYYKDMYINTSPNNYKEDDSYGEREYEEGYAFLEELRMAMGDKKFSQFLKDYYQKYYLKVVSTKEIIDFIKEYDNSKKVKDIINFYVDI